MMFQNTFNQDYYKLLHRYVHKVYRHAQAKKWLKSHNPLSNQGIKMLGKRIVYMPLIANMKSQLHTLSNTNT